MVRQRRINTAKGLLLAYYLRLRRQNHLWSLRFNTPKGYCFLTTIASILLEFWSFSKVSIPRRVTASLLHRRSRNRHQHNQNLHRFNTPKGYCFLTTKVVKRRRNGYKRFCFNTPKGYCFLTTARFRGIIACFGELTPTYCLKSPREHLKK